MVFPRVSIGFAVVLALTGTRAGLAQSAAAASASFADLYDQAASLYEKADWAGCAERFAAASRAASEDRLASKALLKAARCDARAGKKEASAFGLLEQAAARGCRDVDTLATEPDFASLRTDPRWKPVFEKVQAQAAAARKGPLNPELERLYREDQGDRAGDLGGTDWKAVARRDEERRKRVLEILEKGGAKEAGDYIHAAMVLQHGASPEDYDRANRWASKAVELDPDYPGARWLAAASKDRYLMWSGKPQLYGTQFKKDKDGPWYLWQVDPAVTDEERARWDVPPLARAKARVEALNAGTLEPH
jgi:tetratricopeptide (TPR) repeat protein